MNDSVKKILLPLYYALLRTGRRLKLLHKPQVKICISSTQRYAEKTVPALVKSLAEAGFAGNDIYVFEGGHAANRYVFASFHHYFVNHNSIDFTALIEAAQLPVKTDYWFFLHDTCVVAPQFKRLTENIPHFRPETLPVKNYPSMNMGAYRRDYLIRKQSLLQTLRNDRLDADAAMAFKVKGLESEDVLFKQSKDPVVYNGWMLDKEDVYRNDDVPVPAIYTNRICEYFPQVGLYKFKANYRLEQPNTIEL